MDVQWVVDVTARLESVPGLLERLSVVFTSRAVRRGRHIEAPNGPGRVAVRATPAVEAAWEVTSVPILFGAAVEKLAGRFPEAAPERAREMLTELVGRGLLITSLRSPLTVPDPLAYLVETLHAARAGKVPEACELLAELEAVQSELRRHHRADRREQNRIRTELGQRMRRLSTAGRTPVGLDLRLGCDVRLPEHVAHESEQAASALMRLTREPTGPAAWREYFVAFCERYGTGTGTLVPVTEAVHPDAGIGFPAGYPSSPRPVPRPLLTRRDERLAALAWQALAGGAEEITLTDGMVDELSGGLLDEKYIPPHVEIAARLHAADPAAVDRGEFTLTVSPGRSAGTLTARFADIAPGLAEVYGKLPTVIAGALAAQVSVPPVYPHAQNICRTGAFLPHLIPLGEHRDPASGAGGRGAEVIELEDLALTATRERLHLVSVSRRCVVEPQIFHALSIEKQLPPLARFLL